MGNMLVKEKDIVVPGDCIAEGMDYLPTAGTYRLGDKVVASKLGLVYLEGRAVKLIPLSGKYLPKKGDVIIGPVIDVSLMGWRLETNSAYSAMLSMKDATSEYIQRGADLTKYFDIGDFLVTKIVQVTSQKLVDLSMKGPGLRKLSGGRFLTVSPNKVPRIIGKQGSMVSLIKNLTNVQIIVGQNGIIWLSGEPKSELVVVKTIRMIEKQSHLPGLTDQVKAFIEKELKGA